MFIVNLAGHIGKDPETRFTPSGQKVTTFSIATNHRKGKEDVTTWVRVTIWGDRFDKMLSYCKKGSAVIVTGRMNPPTSYVDKEGRTQISLDVTAEMMEFSPFGRSDRQGDGQSQSSFGQSPRQHDEDRFQSNQPTQHQNGPDYSSHASGQGHNYSQSVDEDVLPF